MPKLLIVDDEETIRAAFVYWFNSHGYQVETAENGSEAIDKCLANNFDAVTMDLEMPKMRGLEAISIISRTHPGLPIIVVTGHPREEAEALARGAHAVLHKPVPLGHLEKTVREAIAAANATQK